MLDGYTFSHLTLIATTWQIHGLPDPGLADGEAEIQRGQAPSQALQLQVSRAGVRTQSMWPQLTSSPSLFYRSQRKPPNGTMLVEPFVHLLSTYCVPGHREVEMTTWTASTFEKPVIWRHRLISQRRPQHASGKWQMSYIEKWGSHEQLENQGKGHFSVIIAWLNSHF